MKLTDERAKFETPTSEQDEAQLGSKANVYDDPVEDIAFALGWELERAELSANDYVTVNREKLRGIAQRVLAKAARAAIHAVPPTDAEVDAALVAHHLQVVPLSRADMRRALTGFVAGRAAIPTPPSAAQEVREVVVPRLSADEINDLLKAHAGLLDGPALNAAVQSAVLAHASKACGVSLKLDERTTP